jgi:hypothetical protein
VTVLAGGLGIAAQVLALKGQVAGSPNAGNQALVYTDGAQQLTTLGGSMPVATPTASPTTSTQPPPPTPSGSPYVGATFNTVGQPCHSTTFFPASISPWATPPGCYALIYSPNPANYPPVSAFGYCNWWVQVLHPNNHDILDNPKYPRGSTPVPGAAIFFAGDVQGASSAGHYAQVVAIAPDHYWMLITEMNFSWRGGGFGKVDYRYAHVGPGVTFIYT